MFDPGAMGTLLIGLNAIQSETSTRRERRPVQARRRQRSMRAALAAGLRGAADLLQPEPVREIAK